MKNVDFIVMEYVEKGTLFDYVNSKKGLDESEARRIFKQILSAVEHCHKNGLVHRDLKLNNILITQHGDIKLADFGFVDSALKDLQSKKGTRGYMAPELNSGKPYKGIPTDIFSLGVILFQMLSN